MCCDLYRRDENELDRAVLAISLTNCLDSVMIIFKFVCPTVTQRVYLSQSVRHV